MKKLLLAVTLVSAGFLNAITIGEHRAPAQQTTPWQKASPTKTGGGFMGDMGGMLSGASSAATGIPPINVGFGLGFSEASTDIDSDVSQSANVSGGAQAQIQQGQNVSVYGTSTASTSATGMGGQ